MTLRANAQPLDIFTADYKPYFVKIVQDDFKGRSAADELASAAPVLARLKLSGQVLTARAHQDAEPATVVRIAPRTG